MLQNNCVQQYFIQRFKLNNSLLTKKLPNKIVIAPKHFKEIYIASKT